MIMERCRSTRASRYFLGRRGLNEKTKERARERHYVVR